jgi:hypothetical protein
VLARIEGHDFLDRVAVVLDPEWTERASGKDLERLSVEKYRARIVGLLFEIVS